VPVHRSPDSRRGRPLAASADAARDAGRQIELVLTNETEASTQLGKMRPQTSHPYSVTLLPPGSDSIAVEVGS